MAGAGGAREAKGTRISQRSLALIAARLCRPGRSAAGGVGRGHASVADAGPSVSILGPRNLRSLVVPGAGLDSVAPGTTKGPRPTPRRRRPVVELGGWSLSCPDTTGLASRRRAPCSASSSASARVHTMTQWPSGARYGLWVWRKDGIRLLTLLLMTVTNGEGELNCEKAKAVT
jgi:hypothetical protein